MTVLVLKEVYPHLLKVFETAIIFNLLKSSNFVFNSDRNEIKLFIFLCKKNYPKFSYLLMNSILDTLSSLNQNIDIIYRNYQKKIDKNTHS